MTWSTKWRRRWFTCSLFRTHHNPVSNCFSSGRQDVLGLLNSRMREVTAAIMGVYWRAWGR